MDSSSRSVWSFRRWRFGAGAIALALLCVPSMPASSAGGVTLSETGSTLFYPLFQLWIPDYIHVAGDVSLTAAATGSGAGVDAVVAGNAHMGASDAYMSDEQTQKNRGILNIAVAISAQTVNYNIPGLNGTNLKLDGPTLAGIFTGKITTWDAPAIAAMNPGVQLPHQAIVPIRRQDASGDTFIFTQFLDFSADSWEDNPGYGTSIAWPAVAAEKTAKGNDGVVKTLADTPYSIGYVGISYSKQIADAKLGAAMIENQSGAFLSPTPETIADGAAELDPRTPPYERISLVYAPGRDSYPLINYEYAVVAKSQPDAATAKALRDFLRWAISQTGGNAPTYLQPVGFIALPDFVRGLSEAQIREIK